MVFFFFLKIDFYRILSHSFFIIKNYIYSGFISKYVNNFCCHLKYMSGKTGTPSETF